MTAPPTIHIQLPQPSITDFDSWLWRHKWERTHPGQYVNAEQKEFKTIEELYKLFLNK